MSTITPINSAYRQNLAFNANDAESKRHPVKALLLYGLPGVGEMTNGDTKNGLKHLGIAIALGVTGAVLSFKKILPSVTKNMEAAIKLFHEKGIGIDYLKTAYQGVSKKSLAGMATIVILSHANAIASAIGTYKGKKEEAV